MLTNISLFLVCIGVVGVLVVFLGSALKVVRDSVRGKADKDLEYYEDPVVKDLEDFPTYVGPKNPEDDPYVCTGRGERKEDSSEEVAKLDKNVVEELEEMLLDYDYWLDRKAATYDYD